jgi:hypothetical protein
VEILAVKDYYRLLGVEKGEASERKVASDGSRISDRPIKESLKITPLLWPVFPALVLSLYLVLGHIAPEKTLVALRSSLGVFFTSCCRWASFFFL